MVHAFSFFSLGLFSRKTAAYKPKTPMGSSTVLRGAVMLGLVWATLLMVGCRTEVEPGGDEAATNPVAAQVVETELPPMPGAQPMEPLPEVDIEALEKAVVQERARQARELAAGQREPEQSRLLFEPLPAEAPVLSDETAPASSD